MKLAMMSCVKINSNQTAINAALQMLGIDYRIPKDGSTIVIILNTIVGDYPKMTEKDMWTIYDMLTSWDMSMEKFGIRLILSYNFLDYAYSIRNLLRFNNSESAYALWYLLDLFCDASKIKTEDERLSLKILRRLTEEKFKPFTLNNDTRKSF